MKLKKSKLIQKMGLLEELNPDRLFKVKLDILVSNERGVLAKIATVIADMESNIDKLQLKKMMAEGLRTSIF